MYALKATVFVPQALASASLQRLCMALLLTQEGTLEKIGEVGNALRAPEHTWRRLARELDACKAPPYRAHWSTIL